MTKKIGIEEFFQMARENFSVSTATDLISQYGEDSEYTPLVTKSVHDSLQETYPDQFVNWIDISSFIEEDENLQILELYKMFTGDLKAEIPNETLDVEVPTNQELRESPLKNQLSIDPDKLKGELQEIELSKIERNPLQPRKTFNEDSIKELAESIRKQGLIHEPVICQINEDPEKYMLVTGERRFKALQLLKIKKSRFKVVASDDSVVLSITSGAENQDREGLNPIDKAEWILSLRKHIIKTNSLGELTDIIPKGKRIPKDETSSSAEIDAAISIYTGIAQSTQYTIVDLLNLPEEVKDGIRTQELTMTKGRILLDLSDPKTIKKVYRSLGGDSSLNEYKSEVDKAKGKEVEKYVSGERLVIINIKKLSKITKELRGVDFDNVSQTIHTNLIKVIEDFESLRQEVK